MADGTAIVGERDTGRLLQVFPDRSPPRELMIVPGLDTSGDGGLLGLALSPTFSRTGSSTPTSRRRPTTASSASRSAARRTRCSPASRGAPRTTAVGWSSAPTATSTSARATPATRRGPGPRLPGGEGPAHRRLRPPDRRGPGVHPRAPGRDRPLPEARGSRPRRGRRRAEPADRRSGTAGRGSGPGVAGHRLPAEGGLGGCATIGPIAFVGALDGERVHVLPLEEPDRPGRRDRGPAAASTAGCAPWCPTPRARCGSRRRTATGSAPPARATTRCCGSCRRPPRAARRCDKWSCRVGPGGSRVGMTRGLSSAGDGSWPRCGPEDRDVMAPLAGLPGSTAPVLPACA